MVQSENTISHILVIRLSAMGDVAMTVPILSALSTKYPRLKITVLTREFFKPMFSQLPNVEIHTANVNGSHKGLLGLWRLYTEIKKLKIDAVADLHNVLRSKILKQFFRLSGTPFFQIDKGRAEKKALTASVNKIFKQLRSTHLRYADVFSAIELPVDLSVPKPLDRRPLSKKTQDLVADSSKIKIGIAPFAAFQGKMYPLELMEEVVGRLDKVNSYQLLFFGGGDKEIAHLSKWEAKFINGINCAGKLSFDEELALISNLDLMVSMDSGNGHLGAMFGIPIITLWGVTHPYAGFCPFDKGKNVAILSDRAEYPLIPTSVYGNKIPKGYQNAMATISTEEILFKIKEVLDSA